MFIYMSSDLLLHRMPTTGDRFVQRDFPSIFVLFQFHCLLDGTSAPSAVWLAAMDESTNTHTKDTAATKATR